MDSETYDQITLDVGLVGEQRDYLQDGMIVTVKSYEGEPLSIRLPDTVVATIVETEAVVKGQTAASSYKPAMLDNGIRTAVPPHIESGTRVVISTEDGSYRERARD
jgi:elongation factor P